MDTTSVETRPTAQQPFAPPALVLAGGIIAISCSAILIRLAQNEAPSLVIAAGRLMMAGLLLLPPALLRRRDELRALAPADWRLAFFSGFMLSIHFASWITSLEYTTVASSTVLVTTSALWVGLASPFVLGEPLSRPLKLGILLAMAGTVIINLDPGGNEAGSQALLGNLLAMIGAFSGAGYFIIGRRLRPRLSLLSYTSVVYGTAALFLLGAVLIAGYPLLGYTPSTYGVIFLMALFPQLLGHSSLNWALAFLPAAYVMITAVSEPISASLLAFLIFNETPGELTLLGSVFILAGIAIASRRAA